MQHKYFHAKKRAAFKLRIGWKIGTQQQQQQQKHCHNILNKWNPEEETKLISLEKSKL
jgi:hypothetical protein